MAIQHGIVEKMEPVVPENGKLFIGGISWDTDEERLKEYFSSYGEVVEAVIMRDRLTGRARGFGFVVFLDPAVAQRVVMEKHMIDGRTVEAKKAVPREDHHGLTLTRPMNTIQGSPGPIGPTKKIFVGGLPPTVTENDFKLYFDQFGSITDVVVMYDHNTQRPRGFGFITYDSEESVDRVLYKTFHELNGKTVEVKRAVPKELSPGPTRSPTHNPTRNPFIEYNIYGLNRPNTLFSSGYTQGYNMGPIGGYGVGMGMDSRFSPIVGNRNGSGYNMGMNVDPAMSLNGSGGSLNNMGYGRVLGPYFGGSPNRYSNPIGYNNNNQGSGRNGPQPIGSTRNVWGSNGLTSPGGSGSGFGVFGNNGTNWGSLNLNSQNGGDFRGEENNYGLVGRNNVGANGGQQGHYGNLYRGGSMYGDHATWQSSSNEIDGSDSFGNRLGNVEDVVGRNSEGYVRNYNIANRQSSREIAA